MGCSMAVNECHSCFQMVSICCILIYNEEGLGMEEKEEGKKMIMTSKSTKSSSMMGRKCLSSVSV